MSRGESWLRPIDPRYWSDRRTALLAGIWSATGVLGLLLTRSSWLLPIWLPLFGATLWRHQGTPLAPTLACWFPLGALLGVAPAIGGTAGTALTAGVSLLGLAFALVAGPPAWWLRRWNVGPESGVAGLPPHGLLLRSTLADVDRALIQSLRSGEASIAEAVLADAAAVIDTIDVSEEDPWREPTRLARAWVARLARLYAERETSSQAFAEANRQGRELRLAVEAATRSVGRRP